MHRGLLAEEVLASIPERARLDWSAVDPKVVGESLERPGESFDFAMVAFEGGAAVATNRWGDKGSRPSN